MNKKDLLDAMEKVNIDSDSENRILNQTMNRIYNKESVTYMSKKKICTIAIAATLAIGIVVYAATGLITSWEKGSSSRPEYESFPTVSEVQKDIGYAPIMIEEFKNGYTFENASVVSNNLKDEGNKSVEKFKSITMRYEKDNDELIVSADKFASSLEMSGEIIDTTDGIDFYYTSYTNKVVPPDYKQTAEDKQAEENGELVFSYGSSEVEIIEVQNLVFKLNEIQYTFTQMDGRLTKSELLDMAKEIINK